jgi:hypothetical protein
VLSVDVIRAEHMPPMDTFSKGIDGFVICKYSGVSAQTKVNTSENPV